MADFSGNNELSDRILKTLHLADRRGYGLSLVHLSKLLYCGETSEEEVRKELSTMTCISHSNDVYCLKGREHLLGETQRRLYNNEIMNERYEAIARRFASEYVFLCRHDKYMAYELLRQKPIIGLDFYRQVLEKNRWLETFFPQIYNGSSWELTIKKTFIARVLRLMYSNSVVSYLGESMYRKISSFLWKLMQFSRRNNPEALSGVRWVTEMQKPYALFGDRV